MVDIPRLRQPDNGVNQHVGLAGPRGADGEFAVGPVHRVARLEGHHAGPAELLEVDPQLGRGVAQGDIVVVVEPRDGLDGAADVMGACGGVEVFDGRVLRITAENLVAFFFSSGGGSGLEMDDDTVGEGEGETEGRGKGGVYLLGL